MASIQTCFQLILNLIYTMQRLHGGHHALVILSMVHFVLGSGGSAASLAGQWTNPTDVSALLMIIGGDVVQKALAQGTGKWFTPVCFSFGWVSYAFISLINIIGDGRLLPPPDFPVKVFNLNSGYSRDNKNWVVGRLLRDMESQLSRKHPLGDSSVRISVWRAKERKRPGPTMFEYNKTHAFSIVFIATQLVLASVPIILNGEWDVMIITAAGTVLAQVAGVLPQWTAEKLPNRQNKKDVYALTQGNGSREIVVIIGGGCCLDLEEMSASQSPRSGRPWEKFVNSNLLSKPRESAIDGGDQLPFNKADSFLRRSRSTKGYPYGFWITQVVCVTQSVLWLLLLINVAASRDHNWFVLAIGTIGMFQNGVLAAMEMPPHRRNLPISEVEIITAKKVMDALMDFEYSYPGLGISLRDEFFPGNLRPLESDWWNGDYHGYEKKREDEHKTRGFPRRRLAQFKNELPLPEYTRPETRVSTRSDMDSDALRKSERTSTVYSDSITHEPLPTRASTQKSVAFADFSQGNTAEPRMTPVRIPKPP